VDTTTTPTTAEPARPPARRSRRILAGIALVLACLLILVTTVMVWAHQVAFNTDRFTALVTTVLDDPAVIDPLADAISTQVVDAIGVEARVSARLPEAMLPLAAPLTEAVREAIDKRLAVALKDGRVQQALVRTVAFAHERVMRLLRDESDAVNVVDGYVVIEVFPVVGAALAELQSMGILPADIQLPDLTNPEAPGVLAGRVEAALGVTLPDTFGTIRLMPADRLLTARTVVRVLDLAVILLIILSILLVAFAIWLARDRRRMVIYLAIGTIIAFLLARLAINAGVNAIIGGIADEGLAGAVRSVVDATVADLRGLTTLILIATGIVAIAAYLAGRPAWLSAAGSRASATAGQAGSVAVAMGSDGIGAADARRPTRDTLETTLRDNRQAVERIGIGVIVFIVAWIALGLGVALVGAALVIGLELILRAVDSDEV